MDMPEKKIYKRSFTLFSLSLQLRKDGFDSTYRLYILMLLLVSSFFLYLIGSLNGSWRGNYKKEILQKMISVLQNCIAEHVCGTYPIYI